MRFNNCTILIVDDLPNNIKVATQFLQQLDIKIIYATSGKQAIQRAQNTQTDLILMDVMMPEMDGFETVKELKNNPLLSSIPIIFLTAKSEIEDLKKGFEVGGVDYITKPFNGEELVARVSTHLELSLYRKNLEKEVDKRTKEIENLKSSIVEAMGSLAESRDNETGAHIKRTQYYVKILSEYLSKLPKYKEILTDDYLKLIFKTAPLHDIGKVAIRDNILLKPDKLTSEEFEEMKKHAIFGEDIISKIMENNGETEFLVFAKEIAGGHHEKWDGTGYPRGLKGEEIPLSARIMAIADVYDALISKRIYKSTFTHEDACNIILEGKGKHFDPELIDVFKIINQEFWHIAETYKE